MDTTVDTVDNGIDPEAEVRKLQDLVKKLERQNQILRSKQNRDPVIHKPGTEESDVSLSKQNRTCAHDTDNIKDKFRKLTLEEVDLVDVEKVTSDDDEETWLFESPKQTSPDQTNVSPYKWLRHEFENPSPEVDSARRLLLFKIDELARNKSMSRSSSAGTVGSMSSPTSALSPSQVEHQHDSSPGPSGTDSPPIPSRLSGLGSRVNTGTFTRPKKQQNEKQDPELIDSYNTSNINTGTFTRPRKQSSHQYQQDLLDDLDCTPLSVNTGTFTRPRKNKQQKAHSADELEADDEMENDLARYDTRPEVSDEDKDHTTHHEHKFSDVTSLHVVARMQEESLRQSFSSPLMSPRRSEEYKAKCLSKDSLASTASSHSNSNTSSPPNSPYGSQYLDQKSHASDTHRRSLPNLARSFNQGGLQMYQCDSRLQRRESPPRSLQKPSAMSWRARNPGSGARQSSPRRTLSPGSPGRALSPGSPGRTLSPARTGIPSPRTSGIPRPGGSSKLPQPRKYKR